MAGVLLSVLLSPQFVSCVWRPLVFQPPVFPFAPSIWIGAFLDILGLTEALRGKIHPFHPYLPLNFLQDSFTTKKTMIRRWENN
ncbi:hypothetical protein P167DRAFT_97483 [Morchella conica CCBAS932]|uniref:Uncharacterized protein n=1 Tax=Morchella conica CCBAS932 TaxID=1392247 RepID=A0A3N4KTF7_9PEZI|nr:hypothetical protein P167DRAFT_97483 [Morchella conica CCBAS932]